jgi:1,4-alpha-glucan branching enzyme
VLTDQDIYLFREGTHSQLHSKLGCRLLEAGAGAHFAVWAPNAEAVSVIGDWNGWTTGADPLTPRADESGIWEGVAAGAQHGQGYKYRISSRIGGYAVEKAQYFTHRNARAADARLTESNLRVDTYAVQVLHNRTLSSKGSTRQCLCRHP